jgi:hypothetical protein
LQKDVDRSIAYLDEYKDMPDHKLYVFLFLKELIIYLKKKKKKGKKNKINCLLF